MNKKWPKTVKLGISLFILLFLNCGQHTCHFKCIPQGILNSNFWSVCLAVLPLILSGENVFHSCLTALKILATLASFQPKCMAQWYMNICQWSYGTMAYG